MQFSFTWSPEGDLLVASPPGGEVLASFLGGDMGVDVALVRDTRRALAQAAGRGGTPEGTYLGGPGYALTVAGDVATLESQFGQYPDVRHPVAELTGALSQLEAWLTAHAGGRPGAAG